MRAFWCLLCVLTILTPCSVPSWAQGPELQVRPNAPRQGEALFIRLEAPDGEAPQAAWRGRRYRLFRQGDAWVATLPVAPETPAGAQPLVISFGTGGARQELRRSVPVSKVTFPVQRLAMTRSKASLYTYPGVEKEDAAVQGAARTLTETAAWSGDWTLPVKGRLSTPYGVRRLRNGKAVGRHRGLDLAAPAGTPVLAPAGGRVVLARKFKKHGNTVVLDHGQGVTSIYIHLSGFSVRAGQSVSRGSRLGKVGTTGASTGPHLHWSVYARGTPVDPLYFHRLSKRGVTFGKRG
jgi:murein DD-endopeptidase MepM/ murein hydrolase activator NlpD